MQQIKATNQIHEQQCLGLIEQFLCFHVILLTKSRIPIIQSVIQHRQNPLESSYFYLLWYSKDVLMLKRNAARVCTDREGVVKHHKFHSDFDDEDSVVIFPRKEIWNPIYCIWKY
jgi:hypothetical protein